MGHPCPPGDALTRACISTPSTTVQMLRKPRSVAGAAVATAYRSRLLAHRSRTAGCYPKESIPHTRLRRGPRPLYRMNGDGGHHWLADAVALATEAD
jgi:hypothetical protein